MNLAEIYEAYIACLNARDLTRLDLQQAEHERRNADRIYAWLCFKELVLTVCLLRLSTRVPRGAGFGVTVDEEKLALYRRLRS